MGAILALIGIWPVLFRGERLRLGALVVAGVLIVPALLFPRSLRLLHRGWMAIGHVLGWINTRLILGIIFYALFTPIGFFMRLLGRDPMSRQFEPSADTYRVKRRQRPATDMERQF